MSRILVLLFVIGLVSSSCQSPDNSMQENGMEKLEHEQKTIEVKAAVLKPATFYKEVLSNGVLSPIKKSKLVFKVNENIKKVYVQNGNRVIKGQTLVELEQFNQQVNLEKAKNNLQKAEIDLKDILFAHSPGLADTSSVNPEVLQTARGRSGYNSALIALKEAKYNLEQTIIRAPFNGVLSDIQVKENNFSGNYEYFASIIDNSRMEVVFGLMETELASVSKGLKVLVVPYAFPSKKLEAYVSEINPVVNESGLVQVKALVNNTDGILMDGMNVEVILQMAIKNKLLVPKEAVLLRQDRQMLFTLINDSIAQWVYVKTGLENSTHCTIIEGLSIGDTVIVSNNFNLGHDVVVKANIIN